MAVTITIASTDRTANIVAGSLRKSDVLNQQTDTLTFRVRRYGSLTYQPALGQIVTVVKDGTTIFGGPIVRITETVKATKIIEYSVTANDYSQFLKRKLVTKRYENTTVSAIVSDLITSFTSDGFTTNGVVGTFPVKSISFNRITVAEALQRLSEAVSHVWYVDYDKDIHFFPRNTERGQDLSDTSGNYIYDSLEIVEDLSQVRNSITVQGGEAISATSRTELFSGDGTRAQFALANKFDKKPTVTVGGVARTVGTEYLDNDASFQCMWNFNEKYIRFTSGNIPASGTNNVSVSGTYLFPILVRVPAPASINLYGEYGFAITDASIRSQDEAIDRALAELQSYQNALYDGSFRTYADGFRSGQVITISSTQRGKTVDVLIQSVRAAMRDPLGDRLEYEVEFATLKSIGIIEYLQNQLRSKEIIVDDQETLLNYIPLDDTMGATDSLAAPVKSTGPYVYGTAVWNRAVWA